MTTLRSVCTLFTLLIPSLVLTAQTGPGGIGNFTDNGLWLRADALELINGDAVDFDGREAYSQVLSILMDSDGCQGTVVAYPNPTAGTLRLTGAITIAIRR